MIKHSVYIHFIELIDVGKDQLIGKIRTLRVKENSCSYSCNFIIYWPKLDLSLSYIYTKRKRERMREREERMTYLVLKFNFLIFSNLSF